MVFHSLFFFSSIFSLIVWVYQTVRFFSLIRRKTNYNRKFNMALLNATIWTFLINLFFFLLFFVRFRKFSRIYRHNHTITKISVILFFFSFFLCFPFFRTCILILDTFYHFVFLFLCFAKIFGIFILSPIKLHKSNHIHLIWRMVPFCVDLNYVQCTYIKHISETCLIIDQKRKCSGVESIMSWWCMCSMWC